MWALDSGASLSGGTESETSLHPYHLKSQWRCLYLHGSLGLGDGVLVNFSLVP
jgi:hypothetical protein